MKYKPMGQPVFTCSLPGGLILPSFPRQLHHCMCILEKSYICMVYNCLQWRVEVYWCLGWLLDWMPPFQILVLSNGVWWSLLSLCILF